MHDPRLSDLFLRYRREGDLSALAKLFDALSPEMMRVARHVAGRGVDPEDVVQSTFLASIERAETFDAERPIVPWLMGILINQARLMNRRRATRHEESSEHAATSAAAEPDAAEANEVQDAVARALADLPPTYREVLVAHLAEGKQPHEIARELGRPQGTVRAQLHRGLRLVRRALPPSFAFGFLAALDRSALAAVRRDVLAAAARAKSLPPSAIPATPGASPVGWIVAAAAVVLAVVVGIAWIGGSDEARDVEVALVQEPSPRAPELARAAAPERAVATSEPAPVAPVAPAPVAAVAPATGTLAVRVLDASQGPVAGARIDLLPWGDPFWHERVRHLDTDASGMVTFERVPAGRVGVHVDGGGVQTRALLPAGERVELVVRLEAGLEITGVVRDASGAPIEGAVVEAASAPTQPSRRASQPTGPDGRYVLRDVPRALGIWARAEGRPPSDGVWFGTPARTRMASTEHDFVLGAPVVPLAFTVVDVRGIPLAGAVVTAEGSAGSGGLRADGSVALAQRGVRAVAGADGAVRLSVDRAATERVLVAATGRATRELAVEDVGTLVALTVEARVAGIARYVGGDPAEEAEIEVVAEGLTQPLRARAGSDGRFEVRGVPAGPFTARARAAPDARVVEMRGLASAGATAAFDPELEHALAIRGFARSFDGRPARTWLVKAVREDATGASIPAAWLGPEAPDLRQCYTGDDGSFSVPCVPGATYRLELRPRASWNGPVLGAVDGIAAGASGVELSMQRERAFVRARFVDASGAIASGSITAVRRGSGAAHRADSGADGRVEVDLHPGRYGFFAWPAESAPVFLGEREVGADVVLDLGDLAGTPRGVLRVSGGARGAFALHGPAGLPHALDADGDDLVACGLAPGEYVLRGTRADGLRVETRVGVGPGGDVVLAP